jgi:hypothetical protein
MLDALLEQLAPAIGIDIAGDDVADIVVEVALADLAVLALGAVNAGP